MSLFNIACHSTPPYPVSVVPSPIHAPKRKGLVNVLDIWPNQVAEA